MFPVLLIIECGKETVRRNLKGKVIYMKKESCFRVFVKYSTLNVLGMLGLSCYILADTFFVARQLGSNGLTALNLAIPIYSFIHGSGLMIGMGGGYQIFYLEKSEKGL